MSASGAPPVPTPNTSVELPSDNSAPPSPASQDVPPPNPHSTPSPAVAASPDDGSAPESASPLTGGASSPNPSPCSSSNPDGKTTAVPPQKAVRGNMPREGPGKARPAVAAKAAAKPPAKGYGTVKKQPTTDADSPRSLSENAAKKDIESGGSGEDGGGTRGMLRKAWKEDIRHAAFFVFLPVLAPAALVAAAELAVLMVVLFPFAYLYHLLEHHAVWLWVPCFLLIHTGGIGDLVADILLVYKALGPGHKEETGEMEILEILRVIFTVVGGVIGLMLMVTLKDKDKDKSNFPVNGYTGVFYLIIWKGVNIIGRVVLVFVVLKGLVKRNTDKAAVMVLEICLLVDVLFSGIPLGIVTAIEFSQHVDMGHPTSSQVWELVKLVALALDLVGVAHFFLHNLGLLRHKSDASPPPTDSSPLIQ